MGDRLALIFGEGAKLVRQGGLGLCRRCRRLGVCADSGNTSRLRSAQKKTNMHNDGVIGVLKLCPSAHPATAVQAILAGPYRPAH